MGGIFWPIKPQERPHLHMIRKPLLLRCLLPASAPASHYELIVHNNKTLDAGQHRVVANF